MNTKNNSISDPEKVFQEMIEASEIDYGIITDGLCSTPEDQDTFDAEQKGKPPI